MRAALEAFRGILEPGAFETIYRATKQITRTLGKARETGVALNLMRSLRGAGDLAEGICWEYLVERMEVKLRKQERRLLRKLKSVDSEQLRSQFQILLAGIDSRSVREDATRKAGRAQPSENKPGARKFYQPMLFPMQEDYRERAQRTFGELAQPVLSFRPRYQFHRATDDRLHEMRIDAKKLRYAMEIFSPIWPRDLQDQIRDARVLQNAGGQYHDWCVLCEILKNEIRRFHDGDNTHLVFQIGRFLAFAEDRKTELRKKILPAISAFQSALRRILSNSESESEPCRSPARKHPRRRQLYRRF
jgi:CHAD domain-containing protein